MSPVQAWFRPAMARRTVDLPDPDSPTRPKDAPLATEKDAPSTAIVRASRLPKPTTRSSTRSITGPRAKPDRVREPAASRRADRFEAALRATRAYRDASQLRG